MSTITNTAQAVTINAATLRDLLTGTSQFADSGRNAVATLNGVALSAAGGELRAVATDRYRLLVGSAPVGEGDLLDQAILPLASVKAILADIKEMNQEVTISRVADIVSVSVAGNSRTISLIDGIFPPYEQLFSSERVSTGEITINPAFMAAVAKVPSDSKQLAVTFQLNGDNKPVQFTVTHETIAWRGVIMPMRKK